MMANHSADFQDGALANVSLSLPEVSALCLRAARGVGWSWGMAEECGKAACWLAQHGFPWADIILGCLKTSTSHDVRPAVGEWNACGVVCGLHAGVMLAEFTGLPEGVTPKGVTLGPVQDARLLLPFAARCAAKLDLALDLTLDRTQWAHVSATDVALTNITRFNGLLHVSQALNAPEHKTKPLGNTAPLSRAQKAALDDLALCMTVPSTAQSRARAGGDAPDTD